MKIIARIHTDFPTKFGIPRQSGLVAAEAKIVFEKEYRVKEALRGIEGFSHLWLLWKFSETERESWSPTIRPPRLGGNKRVGVFATRSPFRPNPIGLSSVKLTGIDLNSPDAPILTVEGADLMDGTPIYDIKPYLPYADCHPEATCGFASIGFEPLEVVIPEELKNALADDKLTVLKAVLAQDPRPAYQRDARIYGFPFADKEIKFRVEGNILTVVGIS